ncbi:hypothetical protein ABGB18_43985 [Nonomuraea sp. B12E4]|uniref:hypothetical protein n=1 Tax=Nonomuraea sp. B12E4 TaxID=3153564 RepID=UPI00325D066B
MSRSIALGGAVVTTAAGMMTAGVTPAAASVGVSAAAYAGGTCKASWGVRSATRFGADRLYDCVGGEPLEISCWYPGELDGSGSNVWFRVRVIKAKVTGWLHSSGTNGVKGAPLC